MALTLQCTTCNKFDIFEDSIEAFELGWSLEQKIKCPQCVEKELELISLPALVLNKT